MVSIKRRVARLLPAPVRHRIQTYRKNSRSQQYYDRYGPHTKFATSNHSHYKDHQEQIARGVLPKKIEQIASLIPGNRIIEVGSGEGLLSLALAARGRPHVSGIEFISLRYETAESLRQLWVEKGLVTEASLTFVQGDIFDRLDLLDGADTLVAMHVLYHLKEHARTLLGEAARRHIASVALVGNANRERKLAIDQESAKSQWARLATLDGMSDFLDECGYETVLRSRDGGDPVVIGKLIG